MDTKNSNRSNHRTAVKRDALLKAIELWADDSPPLHVKVTDVSLAGAQLTVDNPIPVGSIWHLYFSVEDEHREGIAVIVRRCQKPDDNSKYEAGVQLLWPAQLLMPFGIGYGHLLKQQSDQIITGTSSSVEAKTPQGTIRADGDLPFSEITNINAQVLGSITSAGDVSECNLTVADSIYAEGCLSGGMSRVGSSLVVKTLGRRGCPTRITFNSGTRIQLLEQSVRRLSNQLVSIDDELERIGESGNNGTHAQRERSTLLAFERSSLTSELNRLNKVIGDLRESVNNDNLYRIDIDTAIEPGVELQIGHNRYVIDETIKGPVSIESDLQGLATIRQNDNECDLSTVSTVSSVSKAA